jgi:hypothetical protein
MFFSLVLCYLLKHRHMCHVRKGWFTFFVVEKVKVCIFNVITCNFDVVFFTGGWTSLEDDCISQCHFYFPVLSFMRDAC